MGPTWLSYDPKIPALRPKMEDSVRNLKLTSLRVIDTFLSERRNESGSTKIHDECAKYRRVWSLLGDSKYRAYISQVEKGTQEFLSTRASGLT